MARGSPLLHRIADPENLRLAYWKAARHKRDREDAKAFGACLDEELAALVEGIRDASLPLGRHRFFTIHDPKERTICAACFRERVLHHAIMNVCEPFLDRFQISDSFACRKRRGRTAAVARAAGWTRTCAWFVRLDVHKYYDSIHHDTLKGLLRRRFDDEGLLGLFGRIIDAYEVAPGRGVPIGHLTSQHFGNLYLGAFDRHVKQRLRLRAYMRYMDDMAAWSDRKDELMAFREEAVRYLRDELRLELNPGGHVNRVTHGCGLLGYRLYPDRTRLSRRSAIRFRRRLASDEERWHEGLWDDDRLVMHVEPKLAFVREADSLAFRRQVLATGASPQARTA
jgi:hypothetical protein